MQGRERTKNPEDIDNAVGSEKISSSPEESADVRHAQQAAASADIKGEGESAYDAHTKAQTNTLVVLKWIIIGAAVFIALYVSIVLVGVFALTLALFQADCLDKATAQLSYGQYSVLAAFSSITIIVSTAFVGIKGMLSFLMKQGAKSVGNE